MKSNRHGLYHIKMWHIKERFHCKIRLARSVCWFWVVTQTCKNRIFSSQQTEGTIFIQTMAICWGREREQIICSENNWKLEPLVYTLQQLNTLYMGVYNFYTLARPFLAGLEFPRNFWRRRPEIIFLTYRDLLESVFQKYFSKNTSRYLHKYFTELKTQKWNLTSDCYTKKNIHKSYANCLTIMQRGWEWAG